MFSVLHPQETADSWSQLMNEVSFSATANPDEGNPLSLGNGSPEEDDEVEADLDDVMTILRDRLTKGIKVGRSVKGLAIKAVNEGKLRGTRRDEIESALMEVVGHLSDVDHLMEFKRTRDGTEWSKPLVVDISKKAGEAADHLADVTKIVKVLLPKGLVQQ